MVRRVGVLTALLLGGLAALPSAPTPAGAASPAAVVVRVDQVGYSSAGPKAGYVMSTSPRDGAIFTVRSASGSTVYTGVVGPSSGRWNATYRFVYPLDFSELTAPGTYTLAVTGPFGGSSPPFVVAPPMALWRPALANSLHFYQNERDGSDYIPSALRTAPGHLNDEAAMTYATPSMRPDGAFAGDLTPLGVTIDASGGWWDAGDYLKFVETTSYAEALLEVGARTFPSSMGASAGPSDFTAEVRFGLQWLERMWNDSTRTLYYQVGIGGGNARTVSDHDLWRLPQSDDTYGGTDSAYRYIRHRPVFTSGLPGSAISPNLAGRLAADFGLCAQLFRASDPEFAGTCLRDGEDVYALADTSPSGRLLTTAPFAFYPETQWRDDMELGATELAAALGPGPLRTTYLDQAARWAAAYLASPDQDTLNLYDVGGLAHYELARLMVATGSTSLAVTTGQLVGQLRAQLDESLAVGATTPFATGYPWSSSDTVSHDAGLSVMASEYDALTGTSVYARQAQGWMDGDLGANPWGASFIVGDGTVFPDCIQHQVANLVGSTDGRPPILAGAAVEGPTTSASRGRVDGMVRCPTSGGDAYAAFRGHGAVYRDNVQSYSTDEPAIDLTATTPLAMAWLSGSAP